MSANAQLRPVGARRRLRGSGCPRPRRRRFGPERPEPGKRAGQGLGVPTRRATGQPGRGPATRTPLLHRRSPGPHRSALGTRSTSAHRGTAMGTHAGHTVQSERVDVDPGRGSVTPGLRHRAARAPRIAAPGADIIGRTATGQVLYAARHAGASADPDCLTAAEWTRLRSSIREPHATVVDQEDVQAGLCCVSAPTWYPNGRCAGAVTALVTSPTIPPTLRDLVVRTARKIGADPSLTGRAATSLPASWE